MGFKTDFRVIADAMHVQGHHFSRSLGDTNLPTFLFLIMEYILLIVIRT